MNMLPVFATITLSPALDVTLTCDKFPESGDVLTGRAEVETPGGKGLNVARWLATRGHPVVAAGLLGRDNAAPFETLMGAFGIQDALLRVPGANRRNVMMTSPQGMFKVNRCAFPDLRSSDWDIARVLEPCFPASVCVLAGSLPVTISSTVYAEMIVRLREGGIPAVLDTSGPALERGLEALPSLIKPNRPECEHLLGVRLRRPKDFRNACLKLLERATCVLLSDGVDGCWFADRLAGGRVFHGSAPAVAVVDTTAAGDSLLAEFCHSYFPDCVMDEVMLRNACAAGAAATTMPGALTPPMTLVSHLASLVHVTPVL